MMEVKYYAFPYQLKMVVKPLCTSIIIIFKVPLSSTIRYMLQLPKRTIKVFDKIDGIDLSHQIGLEIFDGTQQGDD